MPFGARVYLSRPGLPMINRATLGYDDVTLQRERWRVYSLQTSDGVIQVAQPWRVRERLAGEAALRVALPLLVAAAADGGGGRVDRRPQPGAAEARHRGSAAARRAQSVADRSAESPAGSGAAESAN